MVSDSSFSYVHMKDSSTVLFVNEWEDVKLNWDDVEFSNEDDNMHTPHENLLQQFLRQEEEPENDLIVMGTNTPMFNSSYANRMKQKNRNLNWKDLDLDSFQMNNRQKASKVPDRTLLTVPDFGSTNVGLDQDIAEELVGEYDSLENYMDSLHQTTNLNIGSGDNNMEVDNEESDGIMSTRNVINPDMSRTFSRQYTTPTITNRTFMHNFSGSTQRTASQQRRHHSDNNSRNNSYITPGHNNIR